MMFSLRVECTGDLPRPGYMTLFDSDDEWTTWPTLMTAAQAMADWLRRKCPDREIEAYCVPDRYGGAFQ
jgi:hypothetical protein